MVIKNAKIYTCAGKIIENGTILIENGKIKAVGENITWEDEEIVIDAQGMIAMPGIVDAHSHIGGFGSDMSDQDLNEMTKNTTPEVEAIYAINTDSKDFEECIKVGITTSIVAPGSGNVIGGLVCAIKTSGNNIEDMCIKNPVALKMALGGNPKGVYGKKSQTPMTRMAIASIIETKLKQTKEYMKKRSENQGEFDQGLENVTKLLKKEIHAKIHCEQFDMLTAIRLSEELDFEFTIDHAWGASDYYNDIINSKNLRGILFGPIGVQLSPGECGKIDIESLITLDKKGVNCAIITDSPILHPIAIILQAGEVVRAGAEIEKALNMITINPAKILGLDTTIGSIEENKDADIVIYDYLPIIDTSAKLQYTIINGEIIYKTEQ